MSNVSRRSDTGRARHTAVADEDAHPSVSKKTKANHLPVECSCVCHSEGFPMNVKHLIACCQKRIRGGKVYNKPMNKGFA